ncbi:hypothetical protein LCGC14_3142070 [marine sediment metagenome]|uniref:Transposase IS3/IS911 family protein n=1 Tax=marine sediment metagenome TaxID=412755 RepID=A0A0F8VWN9_9ZZZZ
MATQNYIGTPEDKVDWKKLEQENKRLKKLLAEAELDKAILKEAMEGNY